MEWSDIRHGSNIHAMLRLIFERGELSQPEAARLKKIAQPSCNAHFHNLQDAGLIEPAERLSKAAAGRPTLKWKVKNDKNFFLGVAIRPEEIQASIIDFGAEERYSGKNAVRSDMTGAEFLAALDSACADAMRFVREKHARVLQCFLTSSGYILPDGTVKFDPNCRALNGINPSSEIETRFHIPCFNDSTQYALNEFDKKTLNIGKPVLSLVWDEGINATVVGTGGTLLQDHPSRAGLGQWDFGHIPIVRNGKPCKCGRLGCLEAYGGGKSLLEAHPEWCFDGVPALSDAIRRRDPAVMPVFFEALEIYVRSLYWLIRLFDIDTFLFSGGEISAAYPAFSGEFAAELRKYFTDQEMENFQYRLSEFTMDKLGYGTALLGRTFYLTPDFFIAARGLNPPPRHE